MHALGFAASPDEYFARANDEIVVVLQTESPVGVQNAEEIYRVPGVDAIFVGPFDLRFTMRSPDGRFPMPDEHEAMIRRVIEIGKQVGTPTGMHCMEPEEALRRAGQGMQFLAVGSDLRMLTTKAEEVLRVLCPDRAAQGVARY
jgi:4-hydroxy-2-oxoheptanedioate aldolase